MTARDKLREAAITAGAVREYNALMRRIGGELIQGKLVITLEVPIYADQDIGAVEEEILHRLRKLSTKINILDAHTEL